MVVRAGIENPNGKFSSESDHPATVLLDWDCRFLDRSMSAQYCSHTDPTKQWDSNDGYDDFDVTDDSEMPELYPGIDPNEYSFLSWDSQNGVWWIQSPVNGTVGSLWVDTDWEEPVYWVGRIGKHWDTLRGDWLLYDEGTVYSGDSFLSAIFNCLTLI